MGENNLRGYTAGAKSSCHGTHSKGEPRREFPCGLAKLRSTAELDQDNTCVRNVLPLLSLSLSPHPPSSLHSVCKLTQGYLHPALGSGILFTYPQIATIAGVQGLVVYAIASALPLLVFGYLGPIIRRKCPEGFVLTEWTRQRYGAVAGIFLSICT